MKISVIIPVYNGASFIENCLNSVYNQGLNNEFFEILAINDGSTDDSGEIIKTYSKKVGNIKLINKENGGVSSARNMGIELAKGDFVLFIDADDELVEGSLQIVYNYLRENCDIDMLVTKQSRYNGQSELVVNQPCLQERKKYLGVDTYKYGGYIRGNAGGAICRTDFLRDKGLRFPLGIKNGEDTIFFGLVHLYAQKVVFLDVLLYRINEMTGSASRMDYGKKGLNFLESVNYMIDLRDNLTFDSQQKGLVEYITYRMLSSMTNCFVQSKRLSYRQIRQNVDFKRLLPLDTRNMYFMKRKAVLVNVSYKLYYIISFIYHKL